MNNKFYHLVKSHLRPFNTLVDILKKDYKQITSSKLLDNLLISFPIWFPLGYVFLALNYSSLTKFLFLGSLFLFAETHFGSTWLFFFDKENWSWLKSNLYKILFLPIYFLFIILFIWRISPDVILIVHYLASGWHVTKQSSGIIKIYGVSNKLNEYLVYFISFICLGVGLANPGILANSLDISFINKIIFITFAIYTLILFFNVTGKLSYKIANLMPLITGISIYLPILFFTDLATATAVGVGMHWCQYIAIIWSLYLRKRSKNSFNVSSILLPNISKILFIFLYAFIMTFFAVLGMPKLSNELTQYSFFYLIPLLFQIYHFYIDGFIWKFSDPHIMKSFLKYVYAENKN